MTPVADFSLDALGLFCPIPVILTQKKIKTLACDQILEILADDIGIKKDMAVWCKNAGHELLEITQEGTVIKLYVRKNERNS